MLNNLVTSKGADLPIQVTKPRHSKQETFWDQLNPSQQHSVMSLGQFGYILTNVRSTQHSVLAILKVDNKTAMINNKGVIHVKSRSQVNKKCH